MSNLVNRVTHKFEVKKRNALAKKIKSFTANYIQQNGLAALLDDANKKSASTGTNDSDYVALHSYVRHYKVKYILECGTGRSTWVLAHALQQNHKQFGIEGKIISMESVSQWYEEASRIFPEDLKQYAEVHYSPAIPYQYSIIRGTAYSSVPAYPYDLIFVDGPELTIKQDEYSYETANMDFIRYLLTTEKPVTAIVDTRLRSCLAYGMTFGKEKVKFLRPWMLGIVENVSKKDMLLHIDGQPVWHTTKQAVQVTVDVPSWLKNEL